MLSDVIVQLLMHRDGVTEAEIRELIASATYKRAASRRTVPPCLA